MDEVEGVGEGFDDAMDSFPGSGVVEESFGGSEEELFRCCRPRSGDLVVGRRVRWDGSFEWTPFWSRYRMTVIWRLVYMR